MSTDEQGEPPRRPRRRWVRVVSGGIVTLLVTVVAIFAVRSSGEPVHDVAVSDGSVWVSGGRTASWARVNLGAHGFDTVIEGAGTSQAPTWRPEDSVRRPPTVRPDVLQDGRNAVGVTTKGLLVPFDTRTGEKMAEGPTVPARDDATGQLIFLPSVVDLRGETIAMVDNASGQVWAKRLDPKGGTDLSGFGPGAPTVADIGGSASLAVDVHGNVKVVSAETGEVVDIPAEGSGFGAPVETRVEMSGSPFADITAVGDRWVVMDGATGAIHHEGMDGDPEELPQGGSSGEEGTSLVLAALQQPGDDADRVAVQTISTATFVDIGEGSDSEAEISSGLVPEDRFARNQKISRPVVSGDCLLAAWGRTSALMHGQVCGEEKVGVTRITNVGDITRENGVAVRHNRGRTVLNDLDTGRVYDLSLGTSDVRIDTWPVEATATTPTS